YVVASAVKESADSEDATSIEVARSVGVASPPPRVVPAVAKSARATAPPASVATGASRAIATPVVVPSTKPVERTIRFARLKPDFGVRMTVDGVPAPDPDPTKPFV